LTGIDGGTAATVQDRPNPVETTLPAMWTDFDAEFFVEWQVADSGALARPASPASSGEPNSL
jgi:hypothetical protein